MKPLGDRVLLKLVKAAERTEGGIEIPSSARVQTNEAEVISVGSEVEIDVSEGDTVMYDKYAGTPIAIKNEPHMIVRSDDLIAVVER